MGKNKNYKKLARQRLAMCTDKRIPKNKRIQINLACTKVLRIEEIKKKYKSELEECDKQIQLADGFIRWATYFIEEHYLSNEELEDMQNKIKSAELERQIAIDKIEEIFQQMKI